MDPIHLTLERWHLHLRGRLDGGLDTLLHPDVVFYSPVVFTPQRGIEVTKLYLGAAGMTFGGDSVAEDDHVRSDDADLASETGGSFGYVTEIATGHNAMLQFETTMGGKYVNGVDILTCDESSMITEFKVMIRPLQAVNMVHQQMQTMLERMGS